MLFHKTIYVPVSPVYGLAETFRVARKVPRSLPELMIVAVPMVLAMVLTGGVLAAAYAAA